MLVRNCSKGTTWGLPTYNGGETVLRPGQSGDVNELEYTTAILLKVGELKAVDPPKAPAKKVKKSQKSTKPNKEIW